MKVSSAMSAGWGIEKVVDGDIAQRLRMFTAPQEDLGSVPSTYIAAHNCL